MIQEALIPCVQYAGESKLPSRAFFRVEAKLEKGMCCGKKEQVKHGAFVAKNNGVYKVRQGEDVVKVRHGNEF